MGNQPSAPSPPQSTSSNVPPVVPPVCDADCQRQKQLSGLKAILDQKTLTKDTDPEGYEQARIAYYTLLNGQGWLAKEKERIAKDEIKPIVSTFTSQYNDLKSQQKNQGVFVSLMSSLQEEEHGDQEELHFLNKQIEKEEDKVNVMNRLAVLGSPQQSEPIISYMPIIVDVGLSILGLAILYLVYTKFDKIKSYFGYSTPVVPMGGKRVLH